MHIVQNLMHVQYYLHLEVLHKQENAFDRGKLPQVLLLIVFQVYKIKNQIYIYF